MSLYSITRKMYGQPAKIECQSLEELNTFRITLLQEFQAGNKTALMALINTEYNIGTKQYLDFLGFLAKATESTMRNHKYFAKRDIGEDDIQEILCRVIAALKSIKIETINNKRAVGAYLIAMMRHSINKYLRDMLRRENRGLRSDEWSNIIDVGTLLDETEIAEEFTPLSPDIVYELETEDNQARTFIEEVGTTRQAEAMLLMHEGSSTSEIAAIMGIDEGTVKVNIAVLKAKLAAYHARL